MICCKIKYLLPAALLAVVLCGGCFWNNRAAGVYPSVDEKPVTLTFMLPQTHFKDFLKESITAFEEEQNICKINVQVIPDNQWVNLIKTKAFTNETPDIVRIDKGVMLQIGADRFVEMTASEPWLERVILSELESKKINGKLYGLPVASNSTIGIVYNKKLFMENNIVVPRSIEEMFTVCERFLMLNITPLYASDKDSWTTQTWFTSAAPQAVPDGTWDKLLTNHISWSDIPEFEQILTDMAYLRSNGYTNANYLMATYVGAVDVMANEQAAMYVSGHFFIKDVLAANPDIELGMAPMVYADKITVIQSQGMFSIFKKSSHTDLAKDFLNWFSQADNMDTFTQGWGYTPLFKDQKPELPQWLEDLNTNYIGAGKTVLHVDSQLVGVDFVDFWSLQQELAGGLLTAKETLKKWDEAYSRLMKDRKMPGWN